MSKKHVYLSFRTTPKNQKNLNEIKSKYDLTIGEIIHRMISTFAESEDAKKTINKLMKQMANFDIGDRVKHKVFGKGDIMEITGFGSATKLTIAFDDIDDKKVIMSSFVKLLK